MVPDLVSLRDAKEVTVLVVHFLPGLEEGTEQIASQEWPSERQSLTRGFLDLSQTTAHTNSHQGQIPDIQWSHRK